ncbi:MAG: hypothetical protein K2H20_01945, partial [Bacilli bacterium]|nr:hypothetical protein [Bacilli bacterium]
SYNEDYTTPIVGKGLTGGTKLTTVPNFIGDDQYEVNTWCLTNKISCTFESKRGSEEYGTIIEQSAFQGELLKSISKITFYYSDGLDKSNNSGNNNNDDDDENNNGDDDDNKDDNPNEKPNKPTTPEEPEEPIIPGGPEEDNKEE